jgi:DNA-binding NarL/FixJ family response regulator
MPDKIKVFIVDDHLLVREGITSILDVEKDIQVVGQASNAEETLSQIGKLTPDIILMDLRMPGVDGIQLTRLVKNKLPSCKVIILTLYDQYVGEAKKVGAKGYLLKDITREDFIDSIKRVSRGEEVYDKKIRPITKVEYEEQPEVVESSDARTSIAEMPMDALNSYAQVKLIVLPPTDMSQFVKLAGLAEEALGGDFRQVEGTSQGGFSVIFNLDASRSGMEINDRLSKIPYVKMIDAKSMVQVKNAESILKEKQQFEIKHPFAKVVFVQIVQN